MTTLEEKSKGLLEVGTHCYECNTVDFLPFKCNNCEKMFCNEHRLPASHRCVEHDTKRAVASPKPKPQSIVYKAQKPAGSPTSPSSGTKLGQAPHNNAVKTTDSNPDTLSKLKALWSNKASAFKEKKEPKLAPLFKLKKEAQGDAAVPIANRVYFYAVRPASDSRQGKVLPVFLSKDTVVGKALDQLCSKLDIINRPRSTTAGKRLTLSTAASPELSTSAIPFSGKLGQHVKDGATIYVQWSPIA